MDTARDGSTGEPGPVDLALANTWPAAMLVGLVTIAIGVIVVAWPDGTLMVLSVLFGIQLLLFGLFRLISRCQQHSRRPDWSASSA